MTFLDLGSFALKPVCEGEIAKDGLFGANFLFNRDGGPAAGTIDQNYANFLTEAQVTSLRYPGGTLAEERLDLSNPEALNANYASPDDNEVDSTVPLSAFLDLCANSRASATIVLPTYRFLQVNPSVDGTRSIDMTEEGNLRSYVRYALEKAAEIGTQILGFELGNEWFVDNSEIFGFKMSPVEYGRIVNYMSIVVQDEIDRHLAEGGSTGTARSAIIVQVGPGAEKEWYTPSGTIPSDDYKGPLVSATQLIIDQITDPDARSAIDGVLMHRYLKGADNMTGSWIYDPFKIWTTITSGIQGFNDVDQYVTEWNVSARNPTEIGLAQFDSIVELFREMLLCGVDYANIWAVQQNNKTRLIDNSGTDTRAFGGLTFGGLAFDICSAQLRGLQPIKAPEDLSGISINAFGSASKSAMFLTNRSDAILSHTIDLAKTVTDARHATIYFLSEDDAGKPIARVETMQIGIDSLLKDIIFGAQETIVIVFSRAGSGATIEGYGQNDSLIGTMSFDTILGGEGNDSVSGKAGDDQIFGENGNDTLVGNVGDDLLDGGRGDDYIDGGAGNDIVYSSPGRDSIFGGAGIDLISFDRNLSGVTLDLSSSTSLATLMNGSSIEGIEGFIGTEFADAFIGGGSNDLLNGGTGNDTIQGAAGSDTLNGDAGADYLVGGEGNDILLGGSGDDSVEGGIGNDTIKGGWGDDFLLGDNGDDSVLGGDGQDSLVGDGGADSLFGGGGNDEVFGGSGSDSINGGVGNDTLIGDDGDDSLLGGSGNDEVFGSSGDDYIDGGFGEDRLSGGDGSDWILGGDGLDSVLGANGNDTIYGGAGRDQIFGGSENDFIFGGADWDEIHGDEGGDYLRGDLGTDRLFGGAGSDTVFGGDDWDVLFGDDGDDFLWGGNSGDNIFGGDGNDKIGGGLGVDNAYGGNGDDTITGGADGDLIKGDAGNDWLYGNSGDDHLVGGEGDDFLFGGMGDDTLVCNGGSDVLKGGAGSDKFIFANEFGVSEVSDFQEDIDVIYFSRSAFAGTLTETEFIETYAHFSDDGVVFDFGSGGVLTIFGVQTAAQMIDDLVLL